MELNTQDNPPANTSNTSDHVSPPSGRRTAGTLGLLIVIAVVLLVGGILLFSVMNRQNDSDQGTGQGQKTADKWHAVFLTNGQVYFGRLGDVDSNQLSLANIYYLQVQQRLQPPENQKQSEQPNISLVKLGRSELHCPVDKMTINRDQVLFWEELKTDSKVVKAIDEYLKTDDANKACYEGLTQQQQREQ